MAAAASRELRVRAFRGDSGSFSLATCGVRRREAKAEEKVFESKDFNGRVVCLGSKSRRNGRPSPGALLRQKTHSPLRRRPSLFAVKATRAGGRRDGLTVFVSVALGVPVKSRGIEGVATTARSEGRRVRGFEEAVF